MAKTRRKAKISQTFGKSEMDTFINVDQLEALPDSDAFQFKNSLTGHFIKVTADSGMYEAKPDGEPFEGITKIEIVTPAARNPAVDQETAQKGENAVLKYLNNVRYQSGNCNDVAIVEGILSEDRRALNTAIRCLYDRHTALLKDYIRRNGGTPQDADDMIQLSVLNFIKGVRSGQFQPQQGASIGAVLYSLCKNYWLNTLRKAS